MSTRAMIGMFLALTAGIVIFLFVGMSDDEDGGPIRVGSKTAAADCTKGDTCLPDLKWVDHNGTTYTKAELAGKVVVVNFWATWCKPCEHEIPAFARVANRYADKVVILGVMIDNPDDQTLLTYMSDHEMSYPVVRKTSDIMLAFAYPDRYPTTYVFDGKGNQRTWKIGAMQEDELSGVIDQILREAN
jgi:thiol-disulfide isomerase/thioredoxin